MQRMQGRGWGDWRWRNTLGFVTRSNSKRSRKSQYSPVNHRCCKHPLSRMRKHIPNSYLGSGHKSVTVLMICYQICSLRCRRLIARHRWSIFHKKTTVSEGNSPSKEKRPWLRSRTYQIGRILSRRREARWAVSIKYRKSRKKWLEKCRQTKKRPRKWHWNKHCASRNTEDWKHNTKFECCFLQ